MKKFNSVFRKVWNHTPLEFPKFSNTRIMMMPVRLGSLDGIPKHYHELVSKLYSVIEIRHINEIGYLTIDEQVLKPSETLRRAGLHVDGYYHGNCGAWGGGNGDGGSWGSVGNGMLTVSNTSHCKAYLGVIEGEPKDEGECDHLQLPNEGELFKAGEVYWLDGACVHESLPAETETARQFVRLSLPSSGPWFEGYTKNPTGIEPSNEILPARKEFMEQIPLTKIVQSMIKELENEFGIAFIGKISSNLEEKYGVNVGDHEFRDCFLRQGGYEFVSKVEKYSNIPNTMVSPMMIINGRGSVSITSIGSSDWYANKDYNFIVNLDGWVGSIITYNVFRTKMPNKAQTL